MSAPTPETSPHRSARGATCASPHLPCAGGISKTTTPPLPIVPTEYFASKRHAFAIYLDGQRPRQEDARCTSRCSCPWSGGACVLRRMQNVFIYEPPLLVVNFWISPLGQRIVSLPSRAHVARNCALTRTRCVHSDTEARNAHPSSEDRPTRAS